MSDKPILSALMDHMVHEYEQGPPIDRATILVSAAAASASLINGIELAFAQPEYARALMLLTLDEGQLPLSEGEIDRLFAEVPVAIS